MYNLRSETTPLLSTNEYNRNYYTEEVGDVKPSSVFYSRNLDGEMRRKLNNFFMDPVKKWTVRGRFPWKICLQIILFALLTTQMYWFGSHRSYHLTQHRDMVVALKRVFLKNWTPDETTGSPASNLYAVHTAPEFFHHVDHVVKQYTNMKSLRLGSYGYDSSEDGSAPPVIICIFQYDGDVSPENLFVGIKTPPKQHCFLIPVTDPKKDDFKDNFSFEEFLQNSNHSLNFGTLIRMRSNFRLRMVLIKLVNEMDPPECYKLNVEITYDNSGHDGLIPIRMDIHPERVDCCMDSTVLGSDNFYGLLRQVLNIFVIVFSFASMILCGRSIYRGFNLYRETEWFFYYYYGSKLSLSDLMDFVDFWYIIIITGDLLDLIGSFKKIDFERRNTEITEFSSCSILLSVAYIFRLVGILRYFNYFQHYNMIMVTFKKIYTKLIRGFVVAALLFFGYCFCGWIVFAPYHVKFTTLSRAAECLFAAMTGDDVYGTFSQLQVDSDFLWLFSRIYLYSYFIMFFYLSSSLFISVITDGFDVVKHAYLNGESPTTTVEMFLAAKDYEPMNVPVPSAPERPRDLFEKELFNYLKKFLIRMKWNY